MKQQLFSFVLILTTIAFVACGDSDDPAGAANRSPVLLALPDTSVVLGDALQLQAAASDLDGDTVTFGLIKFVTMQELREGHSPNAEIDRATGYFEFIPVERDAPGRSFRITAHDGRAGADSTGFEVSVQ